MGQEISHISITLAGETRRFSPSFQRDPTNAEDWKQTLLHAHGQAIVRCMCRDDDKPRRLAIRYRGDTDNFHLARFPDTGHQHDPECIYYSADPAASGLAGYRPGVVEEIDGGGLRIKLKVGLQRRAGGEDDTPQANRPASKATPSKAAGKPAMTLLGLLHLLWTEAGFNRWSPRMEGKRNLGVVGYHLAATANNIRAGRTPLGSSLLVATTQAGSKQELANAERTEQAAHRDRRLVAIAPLARFKSEYDQSIERPPIMGFNGFPFLILDPRLWQRAHERFGAAFAAWRAEDDKVIAIMQLDVPKAQPPGRYLAEVHDIALMRVSKDWIPVESSFEAQVCDALIEAGRRFEKPLQYDADADATFPDFWLQDLGRDFPMEVWGMNTPEYLDRRAQKTQHYNETYGPQPDGWWGWDAAMEEPLPAFPCAS